MTITERMPDDLRLGKVKLRVRDITRSLRFYQETVGFRVLKHEGKTAELTADGTHALVELEEIPGAVQLPPRSVSGLYHYAILLPSRKDLGLTLGRLIEQGVRVGQSDHWVSEALYIDDPDGNGIELYRDRPREEWPRDEHQGIQMGGDLIDIDGLLREAEGSQWSGLPPGTAIGHVHFHVGSLQRAKAFYCEVLGFDVILDSSDFRALFISAGGYHHHIGLNLWAGVNAPPAPDHAAGIDYFTIALPNDEEREKVLNRLRGADVPISCEEDGYYAKDPFGIRMRFTV